jgi:hypothetical protein
LPDEKVGGGRVWEEKRRRTKIREELRVIRKKMQVRKKLEKSRSPFSQCFGVPEGRKVGSTTTLHHTTFSSCGWGDHCNHSKRTIPTTLRSVSGFALPSIHRNNSPLLLLSIFETSATAWYRDINIERERG